MTRLNPPVSSVCSCSNRPLLGHEVQRLENLKRVNDHVRPKEIELAKKQQAELIAAIQKSRLRLDSLRPLWKGPSEVLG